MGPIRTTKPSHKEANATAGPSKPRRRHVQPDQDAGTPGIQKLKSSLRQTRRLLAKDKLAADVRLETERRLKALEGELAEAEQHKKERALATRYHKIKFFERQKVVRKITQTKKSLSDASKSSEKKKLEASLQDLRVDLNYILHYPKLKKYISLFPPEVRGKDTDPSPEPSTSKTDAERDELRAWIRDQMFKAELSQEPEMHLDADSRKAAQRPARSSEWTKQPKKTKSMQSGKKEPKPEQDAFFEDDDSSDDSE